MAIHDTNGCCSNNPDTLLMKYMKGKYILDRSYNMTVQEEALIRMYQDGELERREYRTMGEKKVIYHSKPQDY